ncbi:GNAT family N-acetyltransferase [Stappia sp. GBMRC 2046]|uniref:GNAT family N-acetyltransferase n=1 Tax=Stappia sediminis TaxID=2692190 RepID=A0A7X3S8Z8_9HYPH|nr:N-acetyltransferase [Stappia sediminis]MXN66406.1 GNAT family N-acetyltransferase [Stappia sediminis]
MANGVEAPQYRVRPAESADAHGIHSVVNAAFGQSAEADLVDELRGCGALVVELVAEDDQKNIVGHVAISRVTAGSGPGHRLAITCLAPLSVLPVCQKRGIGTALTHAAVERLKEMGEDLILVVGDPAYYTRLGFDPGLAREVKGPYAGDAFMALALSSAGGRDLPVEVGFATPFEAFE